MKRTFCILLPLLLLLPLACVKDASQGKPFLSFHSYGGGPVYICTAERPDVVLISSERQYAKRNHAELNGAGYEAVFTFTGCQPGETTVIVTESFRGERIVGRWRVTVDDSLSVTLTEITEVPSEMPSEAAPETPPETVVNATLAMEIDGRTYAGILENTPAAIALTEHLNSGPVTITLSTTERGLSGKAPFALPESDEPMNVKAGTLLWDGTDWLLLGADAALPGAALVDFSTLPAELFTEETVTATLWLEWSE